MALDATEGGTSANAYLTQAEGTSYFENRLYDSTWADATSADRDSAIIWATKLLDIAFDWHGSITTQEQALRWPRSGVIDQDYRVVAESAIPQALKDGTAEFALSLLKRDRSAESDLLGQGFSKMKMGEIELLVDEKSPLNLVPDYVAVLLAPLGKVETDVGRKWRTADLVRV